MTDSLVRRIATLVSVRRARTYDGERANRNGDPGREARIAKKLDELKAVEQALREELGIR
jgi:hypothetical protein